MREGGTGYDANSTAVMMGSAALESDNQMGYSRGY
jgi:hypothetical protein